MNAHCSLYAIFLTFSIMFDRLLKFLQPGTHEKKDLFSVGQFLYFDYFGKLFSVGQVLYFDSFGK